ncbi:hypothetical protein CI807_22350 [Pseudomonas sp. NS1(2017)]|uniref:fimbrial protein n=1 Tax=Pseudomonas sp. NS1(2017) TaxID=2025658 RepID=UPI000BA25934|nr:fimbrial protein [Pseudomonas sp. NS1(2017)]ASV38831.1 hypothetical protein CI807_22350 [Pseudomonas sp. NS1(2017)]
MWFVKFGYRISLIVSARLYSRTLLFSMSGLCLIVLSTQPAFARCITLNGTSYINVTLPDNLSIPVNARHSPGDVLWDSQWITGTTKPRSHCYAPNHVKWSLSPLLPTSFPNVYQTGVQGVGVRAYVNELARVLTYPASTAYARAVSYGPQSGDGRVQLIYLGPIKSGQLNLPAVLGAEYYGEAMTAQLSLINNNASIVASTCEITNPNVNISMPIASTSDFHSVGSTFGRVPFTIGLNCSAAVKLNVTFTDSINRGNNSDILSLAPGSNAKGIGYRIRYNSSPVLYGPDSSVAGNVNQISVGAVTGGGALSVPFTIEYVSTGDVQAGSADAMATFTMSYQ